MPFLVPIIAGVADAVATAATAAGSAVGLTAGAADAGAAAGAAGATAGVGDAAGAMAGIGEGAATGGEAAGVGGEAAGVGGEAGGDVGGDLASSGSRLGQLGRTGENIGKTAHRIHDGFDKANNLFGNNGGDGNKQNSGPLSSQMYQPLEHNPLTMDGGNGLHFPNAHISAHEPPFAAANGLPAFSGNNGSTSSSPMMSGKNLVPSLEQIKQRIPELVNGLPVPPTAQQEAPEQPSPYDGPVSPVWNSRPGGIRV